MRWRNRGALVALLGLSLFALWWGMGVPRVERRLQSKLESTLARVLGHPVRSDAVEKEKSNVRKLKSINQTKERSGDKPRKHT